MSNDKQQQKFEQWLTIQYTQRGAIIDCDGIMKLWECWQAAQQAQWQPIETAPRDGTEILVGWNECSERLIVWWHNGWDTGNRRKYYEITPDVWMPLPPEPKK